MHEAVFTCNVSSTSFHFGVTGVPLRRLSGVQQRRRCVFHLRLI